jgi:hypothetical protein
MLAIAITFNIFLLAGLIVAAFVIGFLIRSQQNASLKRKITELEAEMLSNHADILDLQRQKAQLEQQIKESKIPVIPLKPSKEEEAPSQETARKKLSN